MLIGAFSPNIHTNYTMFTSNISEYTIQLEGGSGLGITLFVIIKHGYIQLFNPSRASFF